MADSVEQATFKYVTIEQDDDELVITAGSHAPEAPAKEESVSGAVATTVDDVGAFRETTLDDLEHEPMPKMQRAVLLGIAVLVIVFVAYVLFF